MQHWSYTIIKILEADTINLRDLAVIAGGNPIDFYVGTSINGVDVTNQDLRGMKFTHVDTSKIHKNNNTIFDPDAIPENDSVIIEKLKAIKLRSHHEERLAMIMELVLSNPQKTELIEKTYTDRSSIARNMISSFILSVKMYKKHRESHINLITSSFVHKNLMKKYQFNTERYAIYIAKYLGHIPEIEKTIKDNIMRGLLSVEGRREVLNLLDNKNK